MVKHPQAKFMQRAIELSRLAGIEKKTGGVFGAVIVKGDEIIAEGYNRVIGDSDATCHAEVDAIRKAGKKLGEPLLEGCVLYTSAFCCPMCLCATYWAHITEVYYAATVDDAKQYGDFADVDYYEEMKKTVAERKVKCTEFMRKEAVEVWKEFSKMEDRAKY